MYDFGVRGIGAKRCVYFDHIKTGMKFPRILGQVIFRRGTKSFLLCPIHKLSCAGKTRTFSGFNFNKHQKSPVFRNNINFTEAGTVAAGNDLIFLFSQIFCRDGLAPGAC